MGRAGEIFDADHLTPQDKRKDYGEIRNITIGFLDGRMVVMVDAARRKKYGLSV
jgi:uncharacterized DUF497 family protein